MRLLTLTGPGGIGKTRLALQLGAELLDERLDGVFFVPLAPLADPSLVLPAVAWVLGVREQGGVPLRQTLIDRLQERQWLLVLENFEHLPARVPASTSGTPRSAAPVPARPGSPVGVNAGRAARVIARSPTRRNPALPMPLAEARFSGALMIQNRHAARPSARRMRWSRCG